MNSNCRSINNKKSKSKLTSKSQPSQNSSSLSLSNLSLSCGLDEEAENKFELELCWCIQQLELGINSGKFTEKQTRDTQKNINILKNNNVTLVKKRQIMRTSFGDYRAKMIQEEKNHGKTVSTVKFSMPLKSNDNKSIFIKKSYKKLNNDQSLKNNDSLAPNLSTIFNVNTFNEPFTFHFKQPTDP